MESFLSSISLKKCTAFRNIPTAYPRKHLFNEQINSGEEQDELLNWANASSGIIHSRSISNSAKNTWYKYGSLENFSEFLFDKVDLPVSRFTDGSFPVWYGAEDEVTSLIEIEYHLKIDTVAEVNNGHIDYERAMCVAPLEMKPNADVKYLETSLADYKDKTSSPQCFKEFVRLREKGASSLTYSSARNSGKACYALTQKDEIQSSSVTKFYRLRVYADSGKATDVAEIILEE